MGHVEARACLLVVFQMMCLRQMSELAVIGPLLSLRTEGIVTRQNYLPNLVKDVLFSLLFMGAAQASQLPPISRPGGPPCPNAHPLIYTPTQPFPPPRALCYKLAFPQFCLDA